MTDKDGMAGVMIAADFLIHKLYQLTQVREQWRCSLWEMKDKLVFFVKWLHGIIILREDK